MCGEVTAIAAAAATAASAALPPRSSLDGPPAARWWTRPRRGPRRIGSTSCRRTLQSGLVSMWVTRRPTPRRAWLIFALALLAYVMAVFQRASLGVAGVEAQQRFATTAAVVALFSVLQLAVYASLPRSRSACCSITSVRDASSRAARCSWPPVSSCWAPPTAWAWPWGRGCWWRRRRDDVHQCPAARRGVVPTRRGAADVTADGHPRTGRPNRGRLPVGHVAAARRLEHVVSAGGRGGVRDRSRGRRAAAQRAPGGAGGGADDRRRGGRPASRPGLA